MTTKKQLLKTVEVVNPEWYPYVQGYLNGELSDLYLDMSDSESNEIQLNIANNETCIVGEVFGFNDTYKHNEANDCLICSRFGIRLYENSGIYLPDPDDEDDDRLELDEQRTEFAKILADFYRHRGFMK